MTEEAKKIVRDYWIYTVLFFLIELVCVVGLLIPIWEIRGESSFFFFWGFFCFLLYHVQINKLMAKLIDKSDPYLFEACWEKMKIHHIIKKRHYYYMAWIKYNQMQFEEAYRILNKMDAFALKEPYRASYYTSKSAVLYESGRMEDLSVLEEQCRQRSYSAMEWCGYSYLCASNNLYRAYLNKDYDKMYMFLNEKRYFMSRLKLLNNSLSDAYWTGVIEKEKGNINVAKSHFQFVIDKGNRLYIVQQAKEQLEKIQE